MKSITRTGLSAAIALQFALPALANDASGGASRAESGAEFPLRHAPAAVVRPAPESEGTAPARYLPVVTWSAGVVALPAREALAWQGGETVSRDDGWTEFTLAAHESGHRLLIEVFGRAQIDFAEVVDEAGASRVVDFRAATLEPETYALLGELGTARIARVRIVARAKNAEARIVVLLER